MATRPQAAVGMRLDDVETPALILDLDVFEANLERLQADLAGTGVVARPHAKTHKSPLIARRQIALGAVGVCCQTVGEAEAMVWGGVDDVLLTNEVVDLGKIRRLVALAADARVAVCVDSVANVRALGAAAEEAGRPLDILIELDVGSGQCGVTGAADAEALARAIASSNRLRLRGLQAYNGRAQHVPAFADRKRAIADAASAVRAVAEHLKARGFGCATITGGGTGTYRFEAASGVYTEIQAGSYVFMDVDYAKIRGADDAPFDTFAHSLFVLSSVISRPVPERAMLNAGKKVIALDSGFPQVFGRPDLDYVGSADEHGRLMVKDPARGPNPGEKLLLVPGHCDPNVNLFDWYVCVRRGRVEAVWPVAARGASA